MHDGNLIVWACRVIAVYYLALSGCINYTAYMVTAMLKSLPVSGCLACTCVKHIYMFVILYTYVSTNQLVRVRACVCMRACVRACVRVRYICEGGVSLAV